MAEYSKLVTSEEIEISSNTTSSNSVLISTPPTEFRPKKLEEFVDEELLSLVENLPEVLEAKSNIGLSDFEIARSSQNWPKSKRFQPQADTKLYRFGTLPSQILGRQRVYRYNYRL